MDGGSGSGCGCCGCGCGCLVVFVAIIVAIVLIFGLIVPMNHNYEYMVPDEFQEYYPDFNDGSSIPADKETILPCYELSEPFAVTYAAF